MWIIQQFNAPDPIAAVGENGEVANYNPVWGIFAVGSHYCGAQIRANKTDQGDGIINSANGACEFVVFEDKAV